MSKDALLSAENEAGGLTAGSREAWRGCVSIKPPVTQPRGPEQPTRGQVQGEASTGHACSLTATAEAEGPQTGGHGENAAEQGAPSSDHGGSRSNKNIT